jgi:histidinol-phosphate/aromatic aminotransferase/cobyric acid decarboxylase-like protein
MNDNTQRLTVARAAYDAVPLYDPKRAPVELDLTDNTNLWGMPPVAERTWRELPVSRITRYPTLYAAELKQALAGFVGVTPDMIVTGCGSDDILDSAMRAFGEPGDLVAGTEPSFAMIPIFARMNALAYTGVVELPSHQLVQQCDRLLVIRTMSKAFGLAGLRIGYAIGQPSLVMEVEKSRGPYKLNAMAEQTALAALQHDMPWVNEHVALAVTLRERLAEALRTRGFAPLASHANFVCVPVADCVNVGLALRERGVAVRPFPGLPHIGDTLRISVGPWPLLERFLAAFDEVMAARGAA